MNVCVCVCDRTTWNYLSLYLEYKRDKIKDGSW